MASVKFGGGIIEMRGAIAGTVFSRNRGGNYARAKTTPINPQSDRQSVVRAAMAFLTARWAQTLTANQRTAWNLYGSNVAVLNRLGESVFDSGFNHYIRSNMIRKQVALAIVDDGPVVFEIPASDPTWAVTASEATQQISMTYDDGMDWASVTGAFLIAFCGKPQNPQINFFDGPWRIFGVVAGIDAAPPAPPAAQAAPWAISELQRLWVYARILKLDGRLSAPFRADTFCAA